MMRAFIQQLWKLKLKWDAELDEALSRQWKKMEETLPQLNQVRIPRWLSDKASRGSTLHVFSDASRTAYGAVAYVCNQLPDGTAACKIVASKAHVAGVKGLTIPRLELKAAVTPIGAHPQGDCNSVRRSVSLDGL